MSSRFQPIDLPDAEPGKRRNKGNAFNASIIRADDAEKMQFRPFAACTAKPADEPVEQAPRETTHESHGRPTVTLERKGKRVVGIKVHCGCGDVIELQCHYPEKDAPGAEAPGAAE